MAEITRRQRALHRVARHCSEHGWVPTLTGLCPRCYPPLGIAYRRRVVLWGGGRWSDLQFGSRTDLIRAERLRRQARLIRSVKAVGAVYARMGRSALETIKAFERLLREAGYGPQR